MLRPLHSTRKLSPAARRALEIAVREGMVHAGYNVIDGHGYIVNARAIDALAARGLVTLCLGPDSGMAARPTDAGRAQLGGVEDENG